MEYLTYMELAGKEYPVRAFYTYHPGSAGAWRGGVQIEPDETPVVEIERIEVRTPHGWEALPFLPSVVDWLVHDIKLEHEQ